MELKGFKKLNEAVSPELLGNDELTKLEDAVLDKELGRPVKRNGWAKFNTNSAGANIVSLHEVVTGNDGATPGKNYLLAGIGGGLYKSLDGTGTFSPISGQGDAPYRMQAYADEFIFTEGSAVPFIVSGNELEDDSDLEIEAPDITSVTTGYNASGSLDQNSNYKWIFVYITATGEKSPPSIPMSAYSQSDDVIYTSIGTRHRIGFQGLPVSSDARVTGRQIYRTLGNGEVYYFHSQIDNVITTWFDGVSDDDLGSETFDFLNIPATAEYVTLHKERIIFGNITRLVKNWIMPHYSNMAAANFDVTFHGATYTFSKQDDYGIKDCIPYPDIIGRTGTLTAGTYTYRFVFFDQEGLMSDPMDTNGVVVDGTTNKSVVIYTPPQIASGYDVIARAEVYRKKDSGNFELVFEYDPQDLDLIQVDTSEADALIDIGWTATTTYTTSQVTEVEKCGVAFSDIGKPAVYNLEDIRNIFPDDGDEITGIYDDIDGFIIWKVRSICKIFTGQGSPDNWRLVKLLTNIGCDEPNSLLKFGNDYVFSHQKMIYSFNSSSGLKKIGLEIIDSLKLVTAYHCATADDNWYIIGVTGAGLTSGFGFLIFDRVLETWYKFNITSIPYVAKIKEQGSTAGTILTSNADYILKYGTGTVDTNTGSNVDIVPVIRTKTFGDGIALERLRKLRFNYKKIDDKTLTITVVNPDTIVTNTHADTTNATNSSDFKLYEDGVGDSDSLKVTEKFYINVTGAGLSEWGTLRLDTYPILRGKRNVR